MAIIMNTLTKRLARIVFNKEVNLLLTSLFALLTIYGTLVAIFGRPFICPICPVTTTTSNNNNSNRTLTNNNNNSNNNNRTLTINNNYSSTNSPSSVEEVAADLRVRSVFSILMLWTCAVFAGRLLHHVHLPPLLGMLLVGIAFSNISLLRHYISIIPSWDEFIRKTAFVLILLRCAIGLDHQTLRKSFLFCTSLGVLSTISEVVVIVIVAHFFFSISLSSSVLFGFVLASTSPAVTVPTMIQFQSQGAGTQKGIPTLALAGASVDNIVAVSGFFVVYSVVTASSSESFLSLFLFPIFQLLTAFVSGFFTGILLMFLPRPNGPSAHFSRTFLLCSASMALFFGFKAIKFDVSGPIAVLIASFMAAIRWKSDNPEKTLREAEALRLCWNLFLLPLLFVLIGLLFDLSIFTWTLLLNAVVVIAIGVIVRFVAAFLLTQFSGQLDWGERLFFSTIFLPKATVQAALAPMLYKIGTFQLSSAISPPDDGTASPQQFLLQTCILSILLTAPAGQLLIQILGNAFLAKEEKALQPRGAEKGFSHRSKVVPNV